MELLSLSWNQNYECFAVGTSHGFQIYNCNPFKKISGRNLRSGGIVIVEMLFRWNVLALVGRGDNAQYPPNRVVIWDDCRRRCIYKFSFKHEVRAVKLTRDCIVMVLERWVYVYNFTNLRLLCKLQTEANPRGICCLSHHSNTSVLACPGLCLGEVRIEHIDSKMTKLFKAYDSDIACFAMTLDGRILATASTNGTLFRIFNTMDGTCLQEVGRGLLSAEIYSISLSPNVQWLALSSDRGTVHIFGLGLEMLEEDLSNDSITDLEPGTAPQNVSTSLNALASPNMDAYPSSSRSRLEGILLKFFRFRRTFAHFHLPEDSRHLVAFGSHNTVIIVGMDGSFYRCSFDPVHGGEMTLQECIPFLPTTSQGPA